MDYKNNEWPWPDIEERVLEGLRWQYGKACADYIAHVYGERYGGKTRCNECGPTGLCEIGEELSARCMRFAKALKENQEAYR